MKEKLLVPVLIGFISILMLIVAFTTNGTVDNGDSVMHYLFARYAFDHHGNFMNVWAKPLYVFLAAPFAQFGFTGIKIFNIINTLLSMVSAYLIAKRLKLDNSWIVIVFLAIAPMNFTMAFSGLTEPLFAAILISGLCLLFYGKTNTGLIILSFMPFIRSEGLIIIFIVAGWLIVQKKYLNCLWLITGQVVYAIVGYFILNNFLWFYNGNPYSLINPLGHGLWSDFVEYLHYVLGYPLTYFIEIGFFVLPISMLVKKFQGKFNESHMQLSLIWVLFAAYFIFQTAVWALGLFGGGMARIIVGVAPLMAIICLCFFNALIEFISRWLPAIRVRNILLTATIVISIYYIGFNKDTYTLLGGFCLNISSDEVAENDMAAYMKQYYPDYKTHPLSYAASYMSIALDDDYFAPHHIVCLDGGKSIPDSSYILWEDAYASGICGINLETLQKDSTLIRDTAFTSTSKWGPSTIVLFRKKDIPGFRQRLK